MYYHFHCVSNGESVKFPFLLAALCAVFSMLQTWVPAGVSTIYTGFLSTLPVHCLGVYMSWASDAMKFRLNVFHMWEKNICLHLS